MECDGVRQSWSEAETHNELHEASLQRRRRTPSEQSLPQPAPSMAEGTRPAPLLVLAGPSRGSTRCPCAMSCCPWTLPLLPLCPALLPLRPALLPLLVPLLPLSPLLTPVIPPDPSHS